MSLYSMYIQERTNDEIIETDKGFCTYRFLDEKTVYIVDIFVLSDFRTTGEASNMADSVVELAVAKGCSELIGSVVPSCKNSAASMKVLLAYGMAPKSASNDFVIFSKRIGA